MPFDTITGPLKAAPPEQHVQTEVISWHATKKKGSARSSLRIISLEATFFLVMFLSYVFVASSHSSLSAKGSLAYQPITPDSTTQEIQTQIIAQGIKLVNLDALTPASVLPVPVLSSPQIIKRGGFEEIYKKAGEKFGVPWQILAAVHYIETRQSGDTSRGSSAGAIGPMQFMPGTFNAYKQDGDGDGSFLITDVDDAIYTAAYHLAANGAKNGQIRRALYNYNHSYIYVEKVLEYANRLGLYV